MISTSMVLSQSGAVHIRVYSLLVNQHACCACGFAFGSMPKFRQPLDIRDVNSCGRRVRMPASFACELSTLKQPTLRLSK
jgi:hypothetical protein